MGPVGAHGHLTCVDLVVYNELQILGEVLPIVQALLLTRVDPLVLLDLVMNLLQSAQENSLSPV